MKLFFVAHCGRSFVRNKTEDCKVKTGKKPDIFSGSWAEGSFAGPDLSGTRAHPREDVWYCFSVVKNLTPPEGLTLATAAVRLPGGESGIWRA
jgi:hypothetical protein